MNKRNRKLTVGTGSEKGHFKKHDKHPSIDGLVFYGYSKDNEYWITSEQMKQKDEYCKAKQMEKHNRPKPSIQTGEPKGAFKKGHAHPYATDRFFLQYQKKAEGHRELWVSRKALDKSIIRQRDIRYMRRAASKGSLSSEDRRVIEDLYTIRKLRNDAHRATVYHVDHILPLSKGGRHTPSNLQLATALWNMSKGSSVT
jgi:hypothetical protein